MKNKIRVIIVSSIVVVLSILNLIMPIKSFSELENRYLQRLPNLTYKEIFSGEYSSDFEKYSVDQFPLRDYWIRLKTSADLFLLKKDNGRVYFGKNEFLFDVKKDTDYDQLQKNIEYINEFISRLNKNNNISIGLMLIPSKETIYTEFLPGFAPTVDEKKLIEIIKSQLDENIDVIDLIPILVQEKNEYIYYKTDHHWTTLGAYYGYYALSELLEFHPVSIQEFNKEIVSDNFLGSMYRKVNLYKGSPDKIIKYSLEDSAVSIVINEAFTKDSMFDESYLDKNDKYSYFLGGDFGLVDINTNVKNGKSILVIKDSFSNSMVPYLLEHYENIYLIDTRYYGLSVNAFIEENNIDNILFAFNVGNISEFKSLSALTR